jgi:hypothetical protein
MNNALHKYLNVFVIIYLNNILIYSAIEAKHIKHVKLVLTKLRSH